MASQSVDAGNSETVAGNGFTALAGYEFANWNTQADGSGDAYVPGDEITLIANLHCTPPNGALPETILARRTRAWTSR